jgi:hypothetical protein
MAPGRQLDTAAMLALIAGTRRHGLTIGLRLPQHELCVFSVKSFVYLPSGE